MSSSNFADLVALRPQNTNVVNPRKKYQTWKKLFDNIYKISTKSLPFGLGELEDLEFASYGVYDSWSDINNDKYYKNYYRDVTKNVKKGTNANGGYIQLTDAALEDGFKLKNVLKTFYNKFNWTTQYKGDLSALFVKSKGKVSDPFDGKKKVYKAIQWDTLPFSDMSSEQASALNWKLFNFRKGDVSQLDLSKVDWKEVGKSRANTRAFARKFTKLGKADKRKLLYGVSDGKLQEMADALSKAKLDPAQILFKNGTYKNVEKNLKLEFKVKGKEYVALAEDIGWSTANAYAQMNGYKMANMKNDGITNFVDTAYKTYEASKKPARGGWSTREISDFATTNKALVKPLVTAFGYDYDAIVANPSPIKDVLNQTNGLFVKDTTGPSGNGKKGYQFWVEGVDSAPAAYDVNVTKIINKFENINKLTRFSLFEVGGD